MLEEGLSIVNVVILSAIDPFDPLELNILNVSFPAILLKNSISYEDKKAMAV